MRSLAIKTCEDCPEYDHNGAFGKIAYIPVCCAMRRKKLPYALSEPLGGAPRAIYTGKIPDWCPLERSADQDAIKTVIKEIRKARSALLGEAGGGVAIKCLDRALEAAKDLE